MIIRAAVPDDLDGAAELRNALWPESVARHRDVLADFFDGLPCHIDHIMIAFSGCQRKIGFAELSIRNYAEGSLNPAVPFLEGWYVTPGHRKQGVGGALIDAAESWATSLGYTELASDAQIENTVALKAHCAVGFKEVGRTVCYLKQL